MSYVVIRFVEPGRWDWSSRLIAWFTQGKYSHVEFITPHGKALGARLKGGVQARDFHYIGNRKSRLFRIEVSDNLLYQYANSQRGKPYDWLAIVGFIFGRDWQNQRRWFCSEYVTWAILRSGVELLRVDDVAKITPDDVALSPYIKRMGAREVRDFLREGRAMRFD